MVNAPGRSRVALITVPFEAGWLERLQSLSPDLRIELWTARSGRSVPDDLWREAEILYTSFATPLPSPEQAPRLRWVQLYSAGPDPILNLPLFQTPVIFTTTSGVHATNIAEYVLMVVLAWFHRFPRMLEWQQRGQWPSNVERSSSFVARELRGKTIGIVGYGSIGRAIARLASAFGMRVLAMQRSANHRDAGFLFPGVGDPEGILPDRYYLPDQLHGMLNESDVVVIAVPLTSKTRELFGDAAFQAMKPTAFLVNIARGDVCAEAALVRALEERLIAGAALDVFHQEPLPPGHPLWHLPNVFISPHSAGLTSQYDERSATVFEENMRRYLVGEPLYNVVDKRQGY
ncbi:MAG TPA: D-2-hydroxyacid dehydrogenase [Ktedonobacteraceae bacterium]